MADKADIIERGIRATAILGDETLVAVFDEVRNDLIASLLGSATRDDALFGVLKVQALDEVMQKLKTFAANGRYAAN